MGKIVFGKDRDKEVNVVMLFVFLVFVGSRKKILKGIKWELWDNSFSIRLYKNIVIEIIY